MKATNYSTPLKKKTQESNQQQEEAMEEIKGHLRTYLGKKCIKRACHPPNGLSTGSLKHGLDLWNLTLSSIMNLINHLPNTNPKISPHLSLWENNVDLSFSFHYRLLRSSPTMPLDLSLTWDYGRGRGGSSGGQRDFGLRRGHRSLTSSTTSKTLTSGKTPRTSWNPLEWCEQHSWALWLDREWIRNMKQWEEGQKSKKMRFNGGGRNWRQRDSKPKKKTWG